MVVEIRLFGALRKFGNSGSITLEVPDSCIAEDVRELVKKRFSLEHPGEFHAALVDRAALANASRVLERGELVGSFHSLALLPPVCGG